MKEKMSADAICSNTKDEVHLKKEEHSRGSQKKRQLDLWNIFTKRNRKVQERNKSCALVSRTENSDGHVQHCSYCHMEENMSLSWQNTLKSEFEEDYFHKIKEFLHKNMSHFPPIEKIFTFSNFFPLEKTKVVIVGQDPYHNDKQAMGLSFSVPMGTVIPPSLKNIYLEVKANIDGFEVPVHGDLSKWAEDGVLLLNDVLTVERNKPNSHVDIGWRRFTAKILQLVNEKCKNVVFMLWGRQAQMKCRFIDKKKHLILTCGHPSPFSAQSFFGCKHFSKANKYLIEHGKSAINW